MPRTLPEIQITNPEWTMDLDNIYIIYEPDEETELTTTANKIAAFLASYFSQSERVYCTWEHSKINSDTGQRGIKIKNIMYDIIIQCLDQEEIDRIQELEVVNGPWFVIAEPPEVPDPE